MDFKSYGKDWYFEDYAFAGLVIIAVCLMIWFLSFAIITSNRNMEEANQRAEIHKAFKIKCIEAGGSPVSPFEYVKGHGEGYLCINPSAIIEVQ